MSQVFFKHSRQTFIQLILSYDHTRALKIFRNSTHSLKTRKGCYLPEIEIYRWCLPNNRCFLRFHNFRSYVFSLQTRSAIQDFFPNFSMITWYLAAVLELLVCFYYIYSIMSTAIPIKPLYMYTVYTITCLVRV